MLNAVGLHFLDLGRCMRVVGQCVRRQGRRFRFQELRWRRLTLGRRLGSACGCRVLGSDDLAEELSVLPGCPR